MLRSRSPANRVREASRPPAAEPSTSWLSAALVALLLAAPSATEAHEFSPALIDVTWTGPAEFDIAWKTDPTAVERPGFPTFSEGCEVTPRGEHAIPNRSASPGGSSANIALAHVACEGVAPIVVTVPAGATRADVVVRVRGEAGEALLDVMPRGTSHYALSPAAQPADGSVFGRYVHLGVEHILAGWDHLLFVLCLMLVVRRPGALVRAVTGFTIGHSITLALATIGALSLPSAPVEATIALSIVYLAREIVATGSPEPGTTRPLTPRPGGTADIEPATSPPRALSPLGVAHRHPGVVAAAFGLLHGFGFAGVLAELGIPSNAQAAALLAFNVGVELGQLVFVLVALAPLMLLARVAGHQLARALPAYAAGVIGVYWLVERVLAFGA